MTKRELSAPVVLCIRNHGETLRRDQVLINLIKHYFLVVEPNPPSRFALTSSSTVMPYSIKMP